MLKPTADNDAAVEGLNPQMLWSHFIALCNIPRGTYNEREVQRYVMNIAAQYGLVVKQDKAGNIVVVVPASAGREGMPSVCLQAHLDMVCVKAPTSTHDFKKDAIELVRDGDWLKTKGTTMGGDNGIGAAALLTFMTEGISHGPLECLFTASEEDGFIGAKKLVPNFIQSRRIINLDSEEEGIVYVGCAGGGRVKGLFHPRFEQVSGMNKYRISVAGLAGGHSGAEIDKGRGNAIQILVRFLQWLEPHGMRLMSIAGGQRMNAIPSTAQAFVMIPRKYKSESYSSFVKEIIKEHGITDPRIEIVASLLQIKKKNARVVKLADQYRLLNAISALPNGVLRVDPANPIFVETSNNVGLVHTGRKVVTVTCMYRSSRNSQMVCVESKIKSVFALAGAKMKFGSRYPAWPPKYTTPLLKCAKESYATKYGVEPSVLSIHAGLECAEFASRWPDAEIISFGPTLQEVHSENERVNIPSVEKFWYYLLSLLQSGQLQ